MACGRTTTRLASRCDFSHMLYSISLSKAPTVESLSLQACQARQLAHVIVQGSGPHTDILCQAMQHLILCRAAELSRRTPSPVSVSGHKQHRGQTGKMVAVIQRQAWRPKESNTIMIRFSLLNDLCMHAM